MDARAARQLRPGDFVIAPFSNSHRRAQIMRIDWPHFHVCARLKSGSMCEQVNRYRALWLEKDYVRVYGDYNH